MAIVSDRSARPVPNVPLIEGQPEPLLGALQSAHQVADIDDFFDLPVHRQVHGEISCRVAAGFLRISEVAMQRNCVDFVVALLQHLPVPVEISCHEGAARPAGNEFQ